MLKENENYYQIALKHLDNKNYEEALNVLKMALNLEPANARLMITLAYVHTLNDFKQLSKDEVLELEKKAVDSDKKSPYVWKYLGMINNLKGEYDKAINCYNKAIDFDSEDADLWLKLGEAYRNKDKLSKAFEIFKKATKVQSDLIEAWDNLGDIHVKKEEIDNALKCYRKINEIISNKEKSTKNEDLIRFQIENHEKILSIDPYNVDSWEKIGKLYEDLEEYDKAIESLEKATELAPYDTDLWVEIGNTYYLRKKYKGAVKFYEKAIDIAPDKVKSKLDKIPIIESYKKLIETNQDDPKLWINLGYIYEYKNDKKEALKCYEEALRIDPNNALARYKWNEAHGLI
ncbi:MAG: tetratricopeptide repeat protein [Promethearchaeota archaeon]|nr:MAG: tetratricopeptide repeat protein [Candidatus Lokiarchaeota archaeon]